MMDSNYVWVNTKVCFNREREGFEPMPLLNEEYLCLEGKDYLLMKLPDNLMNTEGKTLEWVKSLEDKTEYHDQREGPTIKYKTMEEDVRGMRIHPDLGISINGSPFVSVKMIIQDSLDYSDLTLKSLADREAQS
jgi:hypothetical protein